MCLSNEMIIFALLSVIGLTGAFWAVVILVMRWLVGRGLL